MHVTGKLNCRFCCTTLIILPLLHPNQQQQQALSHLLLGLASLLFLAGAQFLLRVFAFLLLLFL